MELGPFTQGPYKAFCSVLPGPRSPPSPRRQAECPLSHGFPLLIPPFFPRWRVGGVIGLGGNRLGSFLRENTLNQPCACFRSAGPAWGGFAVRDVSQTDSDCTLDRLPRSAQRLRRRPPPAAPHLPRPAPLRHALSPYKADHPVGQARPPPTNALLGSPGRGLRAPASPTPRPRTRAGFLATRGRPGVSAALTSPPLLQLSLRLAGRLESCSLIGRCPRQSRAQGGPR